MKNNMPKHALFALIISMSGLVATNAANLLPPPPSAGQIQFDIINGSGKNVLYDLARDNCGSKDGRLRSGDNKFLCSNYYHEIDFVVGSKNLPKNSYCSGHIAEGNHAYIDHAADGSEGWACFSSGENIVLYLSKKA